MDFASTRGFFRPVGPDDSGPSQPLFFLARCSAGSANLDLSLCRSRCLGCYFHVSDVPYGSKRRGGRDTEAAALDDQRVQLKSAEEPGNGTERSDSETRWSRGVPRKRRSREGDGETLLPSDKMHLPVRHGRYLRAVSRDEGGQVRKNSPDGDKAFIVILGGALSKTGTGRRQLLARAKDERAGISVFVLSTNTESNIRTRYHSRRKKNGKIYF